MKKFPKTVVRRPARGVWFVTLDGHQYNLGPDQAAAFEKYKALLNKPRTAQPVSISSDALVTIIDKFLEWSQEHRAKLRPTNGIVIGCSFLPRASTRR